jgi:hypothetical protein
MRPELEEFARILVEHVRDRAIQMADVNRGPNLNNPVVKRWRAAGVERADVVIPDVVDTTIFALLDAIDQNLLTLTFRASETAVPVDLNAVGEGELGGEYMMSDGWRAQHSKERFDDDNS